MNQMRVLQYLFLCVMLLAGDKALAGGYAYIYIEGDKQTPFYVKLEGQMMPRLGMNYSILPNLDKGATKIDILFQQNKYPAQEFMVLVPETGSRGFILERINDKQFALKDLQTGAYLITGNKAEDDKLPEAAALTGNEMPGQPKAEGSNKEDEDLPAFTTSAEKAPAARRKTSESPKAEEETPPFLSGIEFDPQSGSKPAGNSLREEPEKNTGCGPAMSNDLFESFALRILAREDDDLMLKELRRTVNKKCFSTEQVRILANSMKTQSGRFQVVEMMFEHTSDPEAYSKLETLFNTNFLKQKFRDTVLPAQE